MTPAGMSPVELAAAFVHAPIGMAVLTPHGEITACNAAVGELLQLDPDSLVGRTFFDVTHPDDLAEAYANCARMTAGQARILRHECRFVRADSTPVWVSVSTAQIPATSVPGAADPPAHLVMHVEDVSERKALEAELSHRALHDPLTGLANRTLLTERIGETLRRGRGGQLFYVDLNGFKEVNDRFGHAAGDAVLVTLARRLDALLGPADTAARLGGDEFAVLRPALGATGVPATEAALRSVAARPFPIDGRRVGLTAAVGSVPVHAPSADRVHDITARLLDLADRAMYAAKPPRAV